jgi:hypothetical protein
MSMSGAIAKDDYAARRSYRWCRPLTSAIAMIGAVHVPDTGR